MPLTDNQIKAAKPKDKPYSLFDGGRMFLLINPDGSKYWRLKYRFDSKEKSLSLGTYPKVSLKQARTERDRLKALLDQGIDPAEERKRLGKAAEAPVNTLERVAREWHSKSFTRWTDKHQKRVIDSFEINVFPYLGTRSIETITPLELLSTLRQIEARQAHETAHRVLQRLNAVFRYAVVNQLITSNPAESLKGALTPTPKVNHRAALSREELPVLLHKLETYGGERQTALAIRLILLTFVRTSELRFATWGEFDLEAAEWRIPAERMKMREAHIVPLSRQALAVLAEIKRINAGYDWLFPGPKPHKPFSENCMLYALYRMGWHSKGTIHGFRATASTILNEQGYHPDHIERQLAHAQRNKVRAAYNRAQYLPERRRMMQEWADYLDSLYPTPQHP